MIFRVFRYFPLFRFSPLLICGKTPAMGKTIYDVCVVGSGPGGGITAYALAKAGLKVALVESGSALKAGIDFGSHAWPYESIERIRRTGRDGLPRLSFESNHFTPIGDNPRHGLLRALGGRSLCWAGHCLRFGPLDFKSWPISYDEVAPYYSRAEKFMGVYGDRDGLWNMPDGEYQRGVAMRCPEAGLKRGVARLKAQGRKMEFIALRKAILTEPHSSKRPVCHYCGQCMRGCDVDAKYTSANTPIPMALATGNLTLFTGRMMTRILMDKTGRRTTGVECINAAGATERVEAKSLVLACSAVETARHLLLNRTREFPEGLANTSGQVGKNLTSHFGLYVFGFFPQLANRTIGNEDGTDHYHSLLTGLNWDQSHPDFVGTYQVQCASGLRTGRLPAEFRDRPGFGSAFKKEMRELSAGYALMNMQGTTETSARTFVDLDPASKDRFGLARPRIHLHYTDSDLRMAQNCVDTCHEIIRAAGAEILKSPGKVTIEDLIIDSNHWVGTCRMGRDPKTSVVNVAGQSHDVSNLFIGDASVFAAYPEKNPTLTNIALAWRMSDQLIEKFRAGRI
jgi:choline dehydrogenase-like flavoprotein